MENNFFFALSSCRTIFHAKENYSRPELLFDASPIEFTITTPDGVIVLDLKHQEKINCQIVVVESEICNGIHGYLNQAADYGVVVTLFCKVGMMSDILKFTANLRNPKIVEMVILEAQISNHNFLMNKAQYLISAWKFEI